VFVDESTFYLLPATVRTYAPKGETPLLCAPCSYEHLSVITGITPSGKLLMQVHEHSIRGEQVVDFLQHLLRHLPGKLLIIWDGASIHRCEVVKRLLAEGVSGCRVFCKDRYRVYCRPFCRIIMRQNTFVKHYLLCHTLR
jgi:hypothetical protein